MTNCRPTTTSPEYVDPTRRPSVRHPQFPIQQMKRTELRHGPVTGSQCSVENDTHSGPTNGNDLYSSSNKTDQDRDEGFECADDPNVHTTHDNPIGNNRNTDDNWDYYSLIDRQRESKRQTEAKDHDNDCMHWSMGWHPSSTHNITNWSNGASVVFTFPPAKGPCYLTGHQLQCRTGWACAPAAGWSSYVFRHLVSVLCWSPSISLIHDKAAAAAASAVVSPADWIILEFGLTALSRPQMVHSRTMSHGTHYSSQLGVQTRDTYTRPEAQITHS